MNAVLERNTLTIPEEVLERLRELGLTDGAQFAVHLEAGRLVAIFTSQASSASDDGHVMDADATPAPRRLDVGWKLAESTDLAALATSGGVRPVRGLEALRADFWPDDEGADEFEKTLRAWRDEDGVLD